MWNFYSNFYMIYSDYPSNQYISQPRECVSFYLVPCNLELGNLALEHQNLNKEAGDRNEELLRIQSEISSIENEKDSNLESQQSTLQIKNRNMSSNSLKVFRKYVSDSLCMKNSVILRIIESSNLDYSLQEFEKQFNRKIPKQKSYYGSKFLTSLLSSHEISNFQIIFKILLRYYYKHQVFATVLTSQKILREAKGKQLRGARKIYELCFG